MTRKCIVYLIEMHLLLGSYNNKLLYSFFTSTTQHIVHLCRSPQLHAKASRLVHLAFQMKRPVRTFLKDSRVEGLGRSSGYSCAQFSSLKILGFYSKTLGGYLE